MTPPAKQAYKPTVTEIAHLWALLNPEYSKYYRRGDEDSTAMNFQLLSAPFLLIGDTFVMESVRWLQSLADLFYVVGGIL